MSAWPFVVVILIQMAVGGFSVYTLSAIRAFVTGESLWSKGQHQAVNELTAYLDTGDPDVFKRFERSIDVPLAYRRGREAIERQPPDTVAAGRGFIEGGTEPEDIPSVLWLFHNFRGFPYLERAMTEWKEADRFILELDRIGREVSTSLPTDRQGALRDRIRKIDMEITPRTIEFAHTLDDGARVVEKLLLLANCVLAFILVGLTVWRVGRVMTQRRHFEQALAWQASHDELTGTANRRAFEQQLDEALAQASGACALMFVDLDQFKIINDTCGHAAGDAMLRRLGPALQSLLAPTDLLARLGGDEFGILLPGSDEGHAALVAERIRATIEKIEFFWKERRFGVTASIGLIHAHGDAISPQEMMSHADMACLMAKEKGRNRVHSHQREDAELRIRILEMNWVQRIQMALDEDRFSLHAQEIVPLGDTRDDGIHLEVLLRMRDEAGALVPPSSFLPAAERFGLIKQIDRWVVRRAFRTLAERLASNPAVPIACCGINLSGATIGDGAFLAFLKSAFAEFRIPPSIVCFEVTETTAIVRLDAARAFIGDLKAIGCTFALDDFGSGMSSFAYLKELPVDFLKIDGAFVKNLLAERADRAMVEMIGHVGHVMGKQIVAEFVETQEIAEALAAIGIDYGQGYGLAMPCPFTAQFVSVAEIAPRQQRDDRRLTA